MPDGERTPATWGRPRGGGRARRSSVARPGGAGYRAATGRRHGCSERKEARHRRNGIVRGARECMRTGVRTWPASSGRRGRREARSPLRGAERHVRSKRMAGRCGVTKVCEPCASECSLRCRAAYVRRSGAGAAVGPHSEAARPIISRRPSPLRQARANALLRRSQVDAPARGETRGACVWRPPDRGVRPGDRTAPTRDAPGPTRRDAALRSRANRPRARRAPL